MTEHSEAELDRALAATAAEYADEDRAAAAEEEAEAAASPGSSVRLPEDALRPRQA